MKVNDLLNLEILDIAPGGKALARVEGRVVFVDRGLPGDRLTARVRKTRRGFAEATLERLEGGAPHRVAAPCPHVEICGGCRFQDLDYAEQLRLKHRQVVETLERLGGQSAPRVHAIRPAPDVFHYRNKMEFSFHPLEDGTPVLGLHERGHFERVFPVHGCVLPSPLTMEIVRATQAFASAHRWRAYHPRTHQGMVRFLAVRHLPHTAQCGVHLIAASAGVPDVAQWAESIAALSGEIRTVTLGLNRSRANVAFGESHHALAGDGMLVERLLGLEFEAGPNAFLQTNSRQAEHLYGAAVEAAELTGAETVLDLYCGTGTLTLLLARAAARAVGVESVPEAVASARRNAKRNGIENVAFVEGEARPIMRQWSRGERPDRPSAEVVVVDPPRAGLHPRVVFRVAELKPRRIAYVSCNPATLARDVKDFEAHGYRLVETTPFDMFPHTPHIECVAKLEPLES
jgi:23S rRNA (uracil1939-C5)-methyltransferase